MSIYDYSDPEQAYKNAKAYLKKNNIKLEPDHFKLSTKKNKKYMLYNPESKKWSHFGQFGAEDYLHHKNDERRFRYLKRATNIKGEWKKDIYSPNNLSINILW